MLGGKHLPFSEIENVIEPGEHPTMNTLDTVIASLRDTRLTLAELLKRLNSQGQLEPVVREALAARFVQDQACKAGLSVSPMELQTAADGFRRRHGLRTAADTHAWLAARRLSVDDFEASLKPDILAAKLRRKATVAEVEGHFAAHREDYETLRVALLMAEREDLARELATQVREEGRDLEAVALEQGLPVVHRQLPRKELGEPLTEPLATAREGELVGPIGTPRGFALVLVEERRPAELDNPTRERIASELFDQWLAMCMNHAVLDLSVAGKTA